ncbi:MULTISPECIES: 4'-phosphopantetheinyl transferase superfamily protein [unclassified Streptomyces]|uniref:4'-phosphopantetheinyl transferase family protein n=1 Tax=unclassified Streptomyces TaxID=2593676 RepID=UPI000DC79564|nr:MULTISPECIES: 4'-phosphopantetheinyl transferase superfamily protein [unclassified Streptomyces]AWZ05454.1 4-phosphopantetheinyl transferase [Streptomyces sp. ICC4]AWZ13005.1 4-phosphopantetheinyl transferase [Streptomyces sp. ICC1]
MDEREIITRFKAGLLEREQAVWLLAERRRTPGRGPVAVAVSGGADTAPERTEPIKLWFCSNDELDPGLAVTLAGHWLDAQEQEIADRFLFERDRRQYLVAHALVRRVLALESGLPEAEAVIWRSERGRPFLRPPTAGLPRGGAELDFNLSHAGGHNLLGVVRSHRIGVDVERVDRGEQGLDAIIETFARDERDWVAQAAPGRTRDCRTLRLWTLKEAYSKARGLGLGLPFDSFSFTLDEERGVLGFRPPESEGALPWRFLELEPEPGVLAAVALLAGTGVSSVLQLHRGFPWSREAPELLALPVPVAGL